jgi:hypothetical protein
VISVDRVNVDVISGECIPKFDVHGIYLGCRILSHRTTVKTVRTIQIDENGVESERYEPDPRKDPAAIDRLCPNHQIIRQPSREESAKKLLECADGLWRLDSESSISLYKILLRDYPEYLDALGARIRVTRRAAQDD